MQTNGGSNGEREGPRSQTESTNRPNEEDSALKVFNETQEWSQILIEFRNSIELGPHSLRWRTTISRLLTTSMFRASANA